PAPTLPIPTAKSAGSSSQSAQSATTGASTAQQGKVATVLAFLQGELGKPYQFATAGPDAYDCSGLVVAAFRKAGISLPHQSLLQSTKGVAVDFENEPIQAGDLIFQVGSGKTYISHVGIAISSTQWIQAAQTGDVVKVGPIPSDSRIAAVRRVIN
ncbi:MAG TPA: NlpC/P60 family protein, partial [Ilumatobacteraceae bacterium]|nr:NlpC/P60 family protein [Ilumatobacteraceae bacterium]